jgi:hypothetical protein
MSERPYPIHHPASITDAILDTPWNFCKGGLNLKLTTREKFLESIRFRSKASERFLSCPCDVLDLALVIALLAEIASVKQFSLDLFERQSAAGGVFRPRHISAMKIAGINRIIVKLFERLHLHTLFAPALAAMRLRALHRFALVLLILRDTGKELGGLRIIAPPLG